MSKVLQRGTAALAVMIASVAFITTAFAQMPTSPWKKGAPFPEPDEELYGVAANGKLYVMAAGATARLAASTTSKTRRLTSGRRSSPCRGRPTMRRLPR